MSMLKYSHSRTGQNRVIKIKRVFDFTVALIGIIIFSVVMLVTALLIRIYLGKPVIFKQERPGLHGKPFYVYKFRSMTDEVDEHGELLPDEERLPKLGKIIRKLSLDELPQLFNVLKGELSLVGPRPLLMEYLPLYSTEQARRHEVKPGITGWAQVNGRNAITWEEKFELDVWYVDHQSFWLDLKILGLTVLKVVKSEGINQAGQATMEKFTGTREGFEK
jgi:sugar transferase EpsL